jgi:hypothetical protein
MGYRGVAGVAIAALMVFGCAKSADEIAPAYVSPLAYQNYSCSQIGEEVQRISVRASELSGVQDEKATSDAVVTTVGVIVFWPALFFLEGDGQNAAELARLKGEYETLEKLATEKDCKLEFRKEQEAT